MNTSLQNAFLGSLIADAVALPVHWYYNTQALDRDYGSLKGYIKPKSSHPDSILWRCHYKPRNKTGEILHDQAKFWGRREVHYHQFLEAGDNTINYLLAIQLYRSTIRSGCYNPEAWLNLYIKLMQTPGWHLDTYLEEYHRAFFDRLASGKPPFQCGIDDIHIGGLSAVPALIAAIDTLEGETPTPYIDEEIIRQHVALTHKNREVDCAALAMTRILLSIARGATLRDSILEHANGWIGKKRLEKMAGLEDRQIIGQYHSPACYLPESFTASLCLAWKYSGDLSEGILANARCGGDSCHRGAVVGSLLGAAAPYIPVYWLKNLKSMERLRSDTLGSIYHD